MWKGVEIFMKMKSRRIYMLKIVSYLILFCFCDSFMNVAINSFVSVPNLVGLACVIPLVFATYKSITGLVGTALELKIHDYKEKQNGK